MNETQEPPEAERYPIDVTRLEKGQTIPQSECERICGVRADHQQYNFALMDLRGLIIRESERAGRPLSVAIKGGCLLINTDAQATLYHDKLAHEGERAVFRNLSMLQRTVDRTKLTEEERRDHDRRVAHWSMKAARISQGRRIARPENPLLSSDP